MSDYYHQYDTENMDPGQVSMDRLDEFIEGLYEELPIRIQSANAILRLFRDASDTPELIKLCQNATLLCALVRVLREDGRKSLDLSAAIVQIFGCLSQYGDFHSLIVHYKIGATCYKLIEHELEVDSIWREEIAKRKSELSQETMSSDKTGKTIDLNGSYDSGIVDRPRLSPQEEYDKIVRKYANFQRKQNHLIRVTLQLLINISENVKTEQKIVNKGIIPILVRVLQLRADNNSTTHDLQFVVVMFLKKISIYAENKKSLKELGVVDVIHPLLRYTTPDPLLAAVLRLMYNLSFDKTLRKSLAKCGIVPRIVTLYLKGRGPAEVILRLFYQFSRDPITAGMFTYLPDLVSHVGRQISSASAPNRKSNRPKSSATNHRNKGSVIDASASDASSSSNLELLAFAINLSRHSKLAQLLVGLEPSSESDSTTAATVHSKRKIGSKSAGSASSGSQMAQLMKVTLRTQDTARFKLLQNISAHPDMDLKQLFLPYIPDLVSVVLADWRSAEAELAALQCLFILGNILLPEADWYGVTQKFPALINQLAHWLSAACSEMEDDFQLAVIVLTGTLAADRQCATHILQSELDLIENIIKTIKVKHSDQEFALQIVYALHQFLLLETGSRGKLLSKFSEIPQLHMELLQSRNPQLRRVCNMNLDLIAEMDMEWSNRIREDRFRAYNRQWLEMIESARLVNELTLQSGHPGGRRRGSRDQNGNLMTNGGKNFRKPADPDADQEINEDDEDDDDDEDVDDLYDSIGSDLDGGDEDQEDLSEALQQYNLFNGQDFASDSETTNSELNMTAILQNGFDSETDTTRANTPYGGRPSTSSASRPTTGYRRRNSGNKL